MATIGHDNNGRKRVLFFGKDGRRRTLRLGKIAERDAEEIKHYVEEIAAAAINSTPLSRKTSLWLADIGDHLHRRLAAVGLVPPRKSTASLKLGVYLDKYILGRTDVKPNTIVNLSQARRELIGYFGPDRLLSEITCGDADAFRLHLVGERELAEASVGRRCGMARQFFNAAIRDELISRNPFAGVRIASRSNPARKFFITVDMAARVLAACPDDEWRLLFGLSRYGGLRCPSEHMGLRWCDIDWTRLRMTVRSPKTERHVGKDHREVPIFPQLLPLLQAVREQAAPGTEDVIAHRRGTNAKLRCQLLQIIKSAGLEPWPKLFHNLRSTRQTELTEDHEEHVVCAWLGNSQEVAREHYLQVTDAHFEQATGRITNAPQEAAQNPTQQVLADARPCSPAIEPVKQKPLDLPASASIDQNMHDGQLIYRGLIGSAEYPIKSLKIPILDDLRGTPNGTHIRMVDATSDLPSSIDVGAAPSIHDNGIGDTGLVADDPLDHSKVLYWPHEVARLASVTTKTLCQWEKNNLIPVAVRTSGKHRRFTHEQLEMILKYSSTRSHASSSSTSIFQGDAGRRGPEPRASDPPEKADPRGQKRPTLPNEESKALNPQHVLTMDLAKELQDQGYQLDFILDTSEGSAA